MAGRGEFVIDGQAPEAGQPGKGALDDPALGHGHKAADGWRPAGQFVAQAHDLQVGSKAAPVAVVGEHGDQTLAPARAFGQQALRGGRAVVVIGRVDVASKNTSFHVGDNLAFAAVDILAAVGAPLLKNARGQLQALAVHTHKRRRRGALSRQAVGPVQRLIEAGPYGGLPAPEIVVHGRPRRKRGRQSPPLAPCSAHVLDGVERAAQTQTTVAMHGQQRLHNLPLRVSKGVIAVNHNVAGA